MADDRIFSIFSDSSSVVIDTPIEPLSFDGNRAFRCYRASENLVREFRLSRDEEKTRLSNCIGIL